MNLNIRVGIKGIVTIHMFLKGKYWRSVEKANVLTNLGLKEIRDMLLGRGWHPTHIAIGNGSVTGGSTPSVTDTALVAELDRAIITDRKVVANPINEAAKEIRITRNVAPDNTVLNLDANQPLTEAGLFNRYKAGTMISRIALPEEITKTPDIEFNVEWKFVITREVVSGAENIIVDNGLEIIRDLLFGEREEINRHLVIPYITHYGIGSGTGAPNKDESSLVGSAQSLNLITFRGKSDADVTAPTAVFQGVVQSNALAGGTTINEAGLFNKKQKDNVIQDKMFSRVLLPNPFTGNKTLTWTITLTRA